VKKARERKVVRPDEGRAVAQGLPGNTRGVACAACAAFVLLLLIYWTRFFFVDVMAGLILDGGLAVIWIGGAGMLGWVVLVRAKINPSGALGVATAVALGMGVLSLLGLGLGLAGWLNRVTTIAIALVGPVAWGVWVWRRGGVSFAGWRSWSNATADWGWLWMAAMPALSISLAGASIFPGLLWKPLDPHPFDVMSYHLQVSREWFELGQIRPLAHNVYSFFPANMEMQYLLGMHIKGDPWAAMYFAQLVSLGCMALTVVAVYGIVSELSQRPGAGTVAGVLVTAVPWIPMLGAVAYVESSLLLTSVLALGWMLKAMNDPPRRVAWMALGGAMAGLACGVKYTGVPSVLLVFPAAFVVIWLLRRGSRMEDGGWRRVIVAALAFGLVGGMLFLPWAVRNWVWSGNPVFPMEMKLLGKGHFDAVQVERWDRAHRPPPDRASLGQRLKMGWTEIAVSWQYGYVLLPLGLLAAWVRWRGPATALLVLLLALQLAFWLFFTHLMGRFAILIIPILAILAGLAFDRAGAKVAICAFVLLAIVLGLFGVPGHRGVAQVFDQGAAQGQAGLYRLLNWSVLYPQDLHDIESRSEQVALIGECQPFFYRIPMKRLRYRTVFDTRFPPGVSVIDGWLGESLEDLRKEGIVVVHPGELRRYAKTYWAIPPLPDDPVYHWAKRDEPMVLPKLPSFVALPIP
jgi:hypothetical protein